MLLEFDYAMQSADAECVYIVTGLNSYLKFG